MESHLLQMRGLKPNSVKLNNSIGRSHLLQMRGLKRITEADFLELKSSHLLQMRGLKQGEAITMGWLDGRIFYRCVD